MQGDTPVLTAEQKQNNFERIMKEIATADMELELLLGLLFGNNDELTDARINITLVLPSGVVSGTAISEKTWFKSFSDDIEAGGGASLIAIRSKSQQDAEEAFQASGAADSSNDYRPTPPRKFIHLRNARFHPDSDKAFVLGKDLRVKLSQVSAWSLGSY